jgi:hypothetical protein
MTGISSPNGELAPISIRTEGERRLAEHAFAHGFARGADRLHDRRSARLAEEGKSVEADTPMRILFA